MAAPSRDITAPHPHDIPSGTRIGRYEVDQVVGRGGMGTVYRAFDAETKREVAMKVLHPGQPEALRTRFLAECEAEAKIRHPHVMPVYDRGRFNDDRLYFVMELVYEPITLTDIVEANQTGLLAQKWPRLRHWAVPQRLIKDVFIPVAEGVDAANREFKLLHRDLKPDNILIDVRTRRAYLIDFGICYEIGSDVEEGKIYGTPRFLSPEQVAGKVGDRTDVWGLGAMLYFVLTGRPPIRASSPMRKNERNARVADLRQREEAARAKGDENEAAELAARRTALEDPSMRTVEDMLRDAREAQYPPVPESVSPSARAIVAKAMAKDPADRYAHVGALVADLEAWVSGSRVEALSEQDATGAAVQAAQRQVRRHVATALWILFGLALGTAIGIGFLSPEDLGQVARMEDAQEDAATLVEETDALAALPTYSKEGCVLWRHLRSELDALAGRVAALPEGPERGALDTEVANLRQRTSAPVLVLEGRGRRSWYVLEMLSETRTDLTADRTPLPPGAYRLGGPKGVQLTLQLPLAVGSDASWAPPETVMDLRPVPAPVPPDMVFVPAGPPASDQEDVPAFLIDEREVTCQVYEEFIDNIDDAEERKARVPPVGFKPMEGFRDRFVAEDGRRPVTGLRPEDAAAFAAWLTKTRRTPLRVALRLPTEAEWRRAAGQALLDPTWAGLFRGPHKARDGKLHPDQGPHGVQAILTTPAEIVTTANGFGVKAESEGLGIPPTAAGLARTRVVRGDERVEAGFRLVRPLE